MGVRQPADPLVASRRRGFRQAAAARARFLAGSQAMPKFSSKRRVQPQRAADVRFGRRCRALSRIRAALPLAENTATHAKHRRHRNRASPTMTVAFNLVREGSPAGSSWIGRTSKSWSSIWKAVQQARPWSFEPKSDGACDVGFFLAYEFKSRMLAIADGVRCSIRRFSDLRRRSKSAPMCLWKSDARKQDVILTFDPARNDVEKIAFVMAGSPRRPSALDGVARDVRAARGRNRVAGLGARLGRRLRPRAVPSAFAGPPPRSAGAPRCDRLRRSGTRGAKFGRRGRRRAKCTRPTGCPAWRHPDRQCR